MSGFDPDAAIPAVYMRGGTSKGVFLHEHDLPPAGAARDDLLLRIMGSPDPMQIDGMGGTFSSTSKVIVVAAGPGEAVTYRFAQISVDRAIVDWSGNCGNLTTAVAPFALEEGLVPAQDGLTTVHLVNANTGARIEAVVPTPGGRVATTGEAEVAGVPGRGAPVLTRYRDAAGGVLGALLPFGRASSVLSTPDGDVLVSLVDAAHPNVFVRAEEVGIEPGARSVAELNTDEAVLARVERVRAAVAVQLGRSADIDSAADEAPAVPRIVAVAAAGDADADLEVVAFSMGKVHRGLPMTGALCLVAAAGIEESVVASTIGRTVSSLRIRHPLGITRAEAEWADLPSSIRSLGVVRTARRIMDGRVYPRPHTPAR